MTPLSLLNWVSERSKLWVHVLSFCLNCVGLFGASLFFICLMVYRGTVYSVAPFIYWSLLLAAYQLFIVELLMCGWHLLASLYHLDKL
jgi:hypothetical protein